MPVKYHDWDAEIRRRARLISTRRNRIKRAVFGVSIPEDLVEGIAPSLDRIGLSMPLFATIMVKALIDNHPAMLAMVDQYRMELERSRASVGPLKKGRQNDVFDRKELDSIYDELEEEKKEDE